jgi:hypothetical protein
MAIPRNKEKVVVGATYKPSEADRRLVKRNTKQYEEARLREEEGIREEVKGLPAAIKSSRVRVMSPKSVQLVANLPSAARLSSR